MNFKPVSKFFIVIVTLIANSNNCQARINTKLLGKVTKFIAQTGILVGIDAASTHVTNNRDVTLYIPEDELLTDAAAPKPVENEGPKILVQKKIPQPSTTQQPVNVPATVYLETEELTSWPPITNLYDNKRFVEVKATINNNGKVLILVCTCIGLLVIAGILTIIIQIVNNHKRKQKKVYKQLYMRSHV